jgi:hypothetical protein
MQSNPDYYNATGNGNPMKKFAIPIPSEERATNSELLT